MTCNVARVLGTICVASKSILTPHLFISRETQNYLEMNVHASIYSFQATRLLFIDLPCSCRHPVPSRARRENPKACIITFNFGCFRTFLDFSVRLYFSPKMFLGVPTSLGTMPRCLAPFALPRKASNTPFIHFSWNPKLPRNERTCIHIFVPSHTTPLHWPPCPYRHIVPFGARAMGKSERLYYNLQFWLFLGYFWTSPGSVICLSPKRS